MNEADFAMLEEEKVLRVIALGLAVWRMNDPKGCGHAGTKECADEFLKYLKGEST